MGLPEIGLVAFDASDSIVIARPRRGPKYFAGVSTRLEQLATDYFLDDIPLQSEDVIIDVGANIGEFSMAVLKRVNAQLIACEPEMRELEVMKMNLIGTETIYVDKPLWIEDSYIEWYSKPGTADSSAIQPGGSSQVIVTEATSLDNVASQHGLAGVKLLKIEAEGAEPEVLMGAQRLLAETAYVVVDCGPERGPAAEYTFESVGQLLGAQGFVRTRVGFPRPTALFQNESLTYCLGDNR